MKKLISFQISEQILPYLLIVPTAIILLMVFVYPLLFSIWVSFHTWSFMGPGRFVGMKHYVRLLTDPKVINTFRVTFTLTCLALSIEFILGFLLAWLLREVPGKKKGVLRALIMLPMILNPVVVGLVWRTMYDLDFGVINYFLSLVGILPRPWPSLLSTALLSIVICDVWHQTPFVMLVLSAGMEALPIEPFEAADIDGATDWHKIKDITLPLLKPVILVILIFRIVHLLAIFDKVYTLTGGGPGNSTRTLSFSVFQEAFFAWRIGYGTALSWIMLLVSMGIGYLLIRSIRLETY